MRRKISYIPFNKNLKPIARELRKNMTTIEKKLWNYILRDRQLSGYRFLRQKPILNFIVDFYCSKLYLGIEIDGEIHDYSIAYDIERTEKISRLGIEIIRLSNDEILNDIEKVRWSLLKIIERKEEEIKKEPPFHSPLSRGRIRK